jgi:DNA-binding transcriptional ArsR family regulator
MVTVPRVLDLAGRARTTTVDVVSSLVTEFLVGLQTFQFDEAAHTFDVGPEWFDHVRTKASPELTAGLERLGSTPWGSMLGQALVERWPRDVPGFIRRVEEQEPSDLWLLLVGSHVPPYADRIPPETFRRAVGGDVGARADLAAVAREMFRDKEDEFRVLSLSADETRDLVVRVLQTWYRDVFAPDERDVAPILERDAEAKRRLARTVSDEKLIELATNGIEYVAEAWVGRIVLTPHLAMRPWNVTCAHDDTYVICYPVADESLGRDLTAPPAHLLRLHKALADDKRLRILKLLAGSDMTLQQLSDAVGLAKSTAHHHTVILRSAGLIRASTELEGRYSLRLEGLAEAGSSLAAFLEGGTP